MSEIENVLNRQYSVGTIIAELQMWEDAIVTLADAYRAEKKRADEAEERYENRTPTEWAYNQACKALNKHKKRADDLEAENARLKDKLSIILNRANLELTKDPSAERDTVALFDIATDCENALSQKPPIPQDNPSEIDPHGVEYGVFKLDGEFPS